MDPVSENLIDLIQDLYREYGGNKQAVARLLGITSNALTPYTQGTIGMPKGRTMQAIAQILEQRYGHPFTPRDVMAWMWEKTSVNVSSSEKLDFIATLLDDCKYTIGRVSSEFQKLSSSQDGGDICLALYRLFIQKVSERYDFQEDSEYWQFCEDLGYNPVGQKADHLRDVVLGKAVAHKEDWSDISRVLSALGDQTTVADLLSRCGECKD